jgi:hypothetical protein
VRRTLHGLRVPESGRGGKKTARRAAERLLLVAGFALKSEDFGVGLVGYLCD